MQSISISASPPRFTLIRSSRLVSSSSSQASHYCCQSQGATSSHAANSRGKCRDEEDCRGEVRIAKDVEDCN